MIPYNTAGTDAYYDNGTAGTCTTYCVASDWTTYCVTSDWDETTVP